ncbi:MAG TPA: SPFH domain-containing protein [Rhodanobacteraceae bacterium]|nr:SPFH domain-containing protein [Rhodanobacteraceae bacterium]
MSPLLSTLLVALAVLVLLSIKRIPEGTVYSLRRVDGHARLIGAGTHLVMPLLERVVRRIALTGRSLAIDERVVLDARGQPLDLRGTVYWQVLDAARAEAVIERADELIRTRTLNAIRAVPAPQSESAEARNQRMKTALNDALRERGVLVTRVQLALG